MAIIRHSQLTEAASERQRQLDEMMARSGIESFSVVQPTKYGLSSEQAAKCKHLTVYYVTQQFEGSVVQEAKFPLSAFSDDDSTKNYQSMAYPYPAFETREAADEAIRNQARMGFRADVNNLFKKLTDLIFKRGCTGDSETKLLNDMQDYLREDK